MPNHVHGIIQIIRNGIGVVGNGDIINVGNGNVIGVRNGVVIGVRNGFKPFPTTTKLHGLPEIIRGFKTFSSRRINETKPILKFQWHKSYHDRIIRNDRELFFIRRYIKNNPMNWQRDKYRDAA